MTYDLAIIGGGPAGVAAGVYAARKRLKTIFITTDFGGQSVVSPDIQNWIGEISISGNNLAKKLKDHLYHYEGPDFEIKSGIKVETLSNTNNIEGKFLIKSSANEKYQSKTILITSGASRRRLNVPGAQQYDQRGLTYCASCDGPLFANKEVIVIGGGNAAFETAAQLAAYCPKVTILERASSFKADKITVEKIQSNPKIKTIINAETKEIKGGDFVTGLTYKNLQTEKIEELNAEGIFIEIGSIPNTSFAQDLVELNHLGFIKVDSKTQRTSLEGIWAAGDVTDGLYQQNNIAAGDAIKAIEDIYNHLHLE